MKLIAAVIRHFHSDSLYRNSMYLMMSTFIMAFFGFFFWIINARLFTSSQIGIATTPLSITSLLILFSSLGLNMGLVRYLPAAADKARLVNSILTCVGITSLVISSVYVIMLPVLSPKLVFVQQNVVFAILFVVLTTIGVINGILDSIFIAERSSKYILLKNTLSSIIKFGLPFMLMSFGAFGLYTSYTLSTALVAVLGVGILMYKYNIRLMPHIDGAVIKKIAKFSFANYLAGFISTVPTMILPVIITNVIEPKISAFYYFDMTIIALLFIIPSAATQSLFAEGSHDAKQLRANTWKASKIIAILLIPAVLITLLFGDYILLAFGKEYSDAGSTFLRLMAITSLFTPVNYILSAIFNVKGHVKAVLFMAFTGTTLILGFSLLLVKYGLTGIGIGWLAGEIITAIIYLVLGYRILAVNYRHSSS